MFIDVDMFISASLLLLLQKLQLCVMHLHTLKPLLEFVVDKAFEYNIKFSPLKFPIMLRPKSIGKMGNFLNEKTYSLQELAEIISVLTNKKVDDIMNSKNIDGFNEKNTRELLLQQAAELQKKLQIMNNPALNKRNRLARKK